jgi:methyltransferase (TIGR00027 family)
MSPASASSSSSESASASASASESASAASPDSPEQGSPSSSFPPVGLTAIGVAAIRADESERPDRLFDDPYAAGFARAAGDWRKWSTAPTEEATRVRNGLISWITVRTRFLDDVLLQACAGLCRQVVILGAGLDSRAFRLAWPEGTRLWELDLADVLAFKDRVIRSEGWQPGCERITVPVDLSEDWGAPLLRAAFDPGAPVAWVAEGLLAYLSAEVRDALIARAAGLSVTGSRMGLTLAPSDRLAAWRRTHPDGTAERGDYVALWRSTAPNDPAAWLAAFGWSAALFDVAERSAAYGRPLDEALVNAEGGRSEARLVDATRL